MVVLFFHYLHNIFFITEVNFKLLRWECPTAIMEMVLCSWRHAPSSFNCSWIYKYDFILICVSSSMNKQMRKNTKRAKFLKNPHSAIGAFICIQNAWMNHVEITIITLGPCNYGKTQHVQVRKMTLNFYFSIPNIIGRTRMNLAHSYLYVRKASVGFLVNGISNSFKCSPSLSFNPICWEKLYIHFSFF